MPIVGATFASDFLRKKFVATEGHIERFPHGYFGLNDSIHATGNNRFMPICDIILWEFPLVLPRFLSKEVFYVRLLEQRVPTILFISDDAINCRRVPSFLTARCWDAAGGKN